MPLLAFVATTMETFVAEYGRSLTFLLSAISIGILVLSHISDLKFRGRSADRKIRGLQRILELNEISLPDDGSVGLQDVPEPENRSLEKLFRRPVSKTHPATIGAIIGLIGLIFTTLFSYFTSSSAESDKMAREVMISSVELHHLLVSQAAHWKVIEYMYTEGDVEHLCTDERLLDQIVKLDREMTEVLNNENWSAVVRDAPREVAALVANYAMIARRELVFLRSLQEEMVDATGESDDFYCKDNGWHFKVFLEDDGQIYDLTYRTTIALAVLME